MNEDILEEYIRQYIELNAAPVVTFCWHGGEPLLAGKDYFGRIIELQRKYSGDKKIENAVQTNGILVDEEWCGFFRDNGFLVGISLDGPEDIHDAYRTDREGRPTFGRVMKAVEMMSASGVEFNTLSVIDNLCEGRGAEVYRFLKSAGSRYMQFLPVMEYVAREDIVPPGTPGSVPAPWSVAAEGFGRFMNDVFDQWVISDVGKCYVQLFDATLSQYVGLPPGLCSMADTCGDALVVEHNGDVYSCDHFVYPEYRLGNLTETDMRTMLQSEAQFSFGLSKRNSLPDTCVECKWRFACRGGCPKHRFDRSASGGAGLNALCRGYAMFFRHTEPYMRFMAGRLMAKQPPSLVMDWARHRMGIH
jgi:anaerobic sulfatase-maturating enzyme